ncbi:hypothetical protein LTR53_003960 [Teratosphaeriaceae sp. CCFEE 6253]|nr:hypothetical protein LTR53_003960 [Teratosphaeriaceae sp. CCFEE 6253]
MAIIADPGEVALDVKVYAQGRTDDFICRTVIKVPLTTSIGGVNEGLSKLLRNTIIAAIRKPGHKDFQGKLAGKHDFLYGIGFRLRLPDCFPWSGARDKIIDVVVHIHVKARCPNSGMLAAEDWDRAVQPCADWARCDLYRIGFFTDVADGEDPSDIEGIIKTKMEGAKQRNEIAAYEALLAACGPEAEESEPPTHLLAVDVHDFGNVCYGDGHFWPSGPVTDMHAAHSFAHAFDGTHDTADLMKKVHAYYHSGTQKQIESGVPLLPSYTWSNTTVTEPFIGSPYVAGGIKVGVQFIDWTGEGAAVDLPKTLVISLANDTTWTRQTSY